MFLRKEFLLENSLRDVVNSAVRNVTGHLEYIQEVLAEGVIALDSVRVKEELEGGARTVRSNQRSSNTL